MIHSTVEAMVSGAMVFFDVETSPHKAIAEGLEAEGLGRFTPCPRSQGDSLQMAMRAVGKTLLPDIAGEKHTVDVQPLKNRNKDGYECVLVHHQKLSNDYSPLFRCCVDKDDFVHTSSGVDRQSIVEKYARYRMETSGFAVGQSLIKILKHLHGTCVRQVGGVYYLPDEGVEQWERVCMVFERANPGNQVTHARVVMGESVHRTVKKAIEREVTAAAVAIKEAVMEGTLTDKALERKQQECSNLRSKITLYRNLLQDSLDECSNALKEAETAAAGIMMHQAALLVAH